MGVRIFRPFMVQTINIWFETSTQASLIENLSSGFVTNQVKTCLLSTKGSWKLEISDIETEGIILFR